MARSWLGSGPEFELTWGGRPWVLKVDDTRPGLWVRDDLAGPVLALEGLATPGRWERDVLSVAALASVERHFDRVEATYTPAGWGDLTVRAAWSPHGEDGVDLEVQVSARSVDELRTLEVKLASVLPEPASSSRKRLWVEPRDARAAALSYDGREPDLGALTTLPPTGEWNPLAPRVLTGPWAEGWSYIEMVHPHDVARRITESGKPTSPGNTTRYGVFGHDLERGVVLRARLRGVWTRSATARDDALVLFDQFQAEPPPLGP